MRRSFVLTMAALMLCIVISAPAGAVEVLVGTPSTSGNAFPFGGKASGYPGTEYQQVYDASLFPEMDINTITFFNSSNYSIDAATYTIYLSITSKAVNGLDTATLSNNITGTNTFFWGGPLGGNPGPTFSFSGPTFHYDPAQGNLLIDILKSGGSSGYVDYFDSNVTGFPTSRAHDFGVGSTNMGLVTKFSGTAAPLPPAALLLGSGLAGLMGWRRFRKN